SAAFPTTTTARSQSHSAHRPSPNELIVLHYAVWSETADYVHTKTSCPVLLVYHNVTPARWFAGVHSQAEADTKLGRERLPRFLPRTRLAVADSEYNRAELVEAGYPATDTVPIMVDFARFQASRSAWIGEKYRGDGYTNVLSVGRLAPNKCHGDAI